MPAMVACRLFADDHQSGGDADAGLNLHAERRFQLSDSVDERETGAHGALGIIFMRGGIAKIHRDGIAVIPRHGPVKSRRQTGGYIVEGGDEIDDIFGITVRRKARGADQVADHDRQLALLEHVSMRASAGSGIIVGRDGARGFDGPFGGFGRGADGFAGRARRAGRRCLAEFGDDRLR